MKALTTIILLFISTGLFGQKLTQVTSEFVVTGQIKTEIKITLADLEKYTSKTIGDVVITNHSGEPRGTATRLTGILIKDLLKDMELDEKSPKLFSEFYLTFIAADNYKVVFSWNEIFNSSTGENLFLITSKDGKKLKDMEDRILILTPTDFRTGRRHIKGLNKIVVKRVD